MARGQINKGPRVLVVIAHPDDESPFAVTLYKIAREQHGVVDLFVITNGEAGYKYATLAEQYYHVALTEEKTGRTNLPGIRKKELKKAGAILGVSNYYFANQKDAHYGLDEREPLDSSWNVALIKRKLSRVLHNNKYDFVFCLLPDSGTHGQHKAASLLALKAVNAMPAANRPIILAGAPDINTSQYARFHGYKNLEEAKTVTDSSLFRVDRTAGFSYKNRLNYKIIVNWELAEHKSQGVTQMSMTGFNDLEEFWYFSQNGKEGIEKASDLFNLLKQVPYVSKVY